MESTSLFPPALLQQWAPLRQRTDAIDGQETIEYGQLPFTTDASVLGGIDFREQVISHLLLKNKRYILTITVCKRIIPKMFPFVRSVHEMHFSHGF